jgi:hypothetical protein
VINLGLPFEQLCAPSLQNLDACHYNSTRIAVEFPVAQDLIRLYCHLAHIICDARQRLADHLRFVCVGAGVQKSAVRPLPGPAPQAPRMRVVLRQTAWLGMTTMPTPMQRGG